MPMIGIVGLPVPNIDVCLETSLKMVYGALASKARGESCIRGYWLVDDSILVTLLSANLMESFEPMDDHCWVRATCSLYHRQVGVTFLACEINEYGGWSTGERDTPLVEWMSQALQCIHAGQTSSSGDDRVL
ncbi:hypothetical protein EJB05_14387 [Eragrostis curvula]|uniref:Uncharacterized protein n=1 Tax=Eragrostis curvula TaxID=38414 RepID=A0A5J9VYX8_9POAL|nr:hypothetical protein EJB05_14387 [Eragrostis curvula]